MDKGNMALKQLPRKSPFPYRQYDNMSVPLSFIPKAYPLN